MSNKSFNKFVARNVTKKKGPTVGSTAKDVKNFLTGKDNSISHVDFPKGPNMGPSHAPPLVAGGKKPSRLPKKPNYKS